MNFLAFPPWLPLLPLTRSYYLLNRWSFFSIASLISPTLVQRPYFVNGKRSWSPEIDSDSLSNLAYDKQGYRTGPPGWESIPGYLEKLANTGSAFSLERVTERVENLSSQETGA
jgi:hypothetical protein